MEQCENSSSWRWEAASWCEVLGIITQDEAPEGHWCHWTPPIAPFIRLQWCYRSWLISQDSLQAPSGHKGLYCWAMKQLYSVTWIKTQDKDMVDTLALIAGQSLFFHLCLLKIKNLVTALGRMVGPQHCWHCCPLLCQLERDEKVGIISAQGTQASSQHWPGEAPQSPGGPFSELGCQSLEGELREKHVLEKEEGPWNHLDPDSCRAGVGRSHCQGLEQGSRPERGATFSSAPWLPASLASTWDWAWVAES